VFEAVSKCAAKKEFILILFPFREESMMICSP
jgi:hypothetical protein